MPVIPEGSLLFDFPDADNWHAFKYDEKDKSRPGFYQECLEKTDGIKGVDIVAGISPGFHTITLIEIKDFSGHAHDLKEEVRSGAIPLEILQKAPHTCSGLYLGARNKTPLLAPDLRAAVRRPSQRLEVVFFLAEDPVRTSLPAHERRQKELSRRTRRQDLLKKMREKFKPLGIPCDLAELGDLPERCGWTVTTPQATDET
ncbi:hypothetical protein [Hymenobacter terricola]|uniref:hypothetical protein n=1 Tax=Hymenobacter terricola TaxID=2819236 RepID=UPI001B30E519|nr:hypothetical protein [Hymenobacter terricola]